MLQLFLTSSFKRLLIWLIADFFAYTSLWNNTLPYSNAEFNTDKNNDDKMS